jgi:DNA-binding winged helix-turn-helix (wHTH) protein
VSHIDCFPLYRLDPANAQLWRDDQEISPRPNTFEILRYLVEHPGLLVTKAMLLYAVWTEVAVSDTMPATCVAELRRLLGDDARNPRFIDCSTNRVGPASDFGDLSVGGDIRR